ncbi:RNB domain-containing ribonuclease [Aquihabitans sp. G128]|uniref:RNB domain-containing ribonuclease n=1 Tax=Aquihabitans sp. G128 TaxID=2849779 RepID=UPI001C22E2B6|nr:RNB domain-containing ribonuclease [Aquihabitans sp. G128]QXC62166.1 RNB domain-containing ribonuclease [Aquihabitans sp. G128]
MVLRRFRAPSIPSLDFGAIRAELGVPGPFPAEVEAAAEAAAAEPHLPDHDATDLELVTIDPAGSMDLDQAVAIAPADGGGWRVSYAIADVASWVAPGGPVDVEARARTQTFYLPDGRTPLHPPALGEAAASLLPDGPRPAVLWTIDVAADGTTRAIDVRRAVVRSRAQLTYAGVQEALDAGTAPEAIRAFPDLGRALLADARARNAIELGLPEQEVVATPDGHWTVELRGDLAIEQWNAQVSLLTGRAAASLMLGAGIGIGILRTLPTPDPESFPRLQRAARSLGIDWPDGAHPGAVLAALDTSRPKHAAFADLAAELLRGAAYTAFDGPPPADPGHAGVGAPYAHVTAPLRRLVDRFGTEVCLAVAAGTEVPAWAKDALPQLPELMAAGDSRSHKVDRAVVDATEAFVLADRVGDTFPASVVESGKDYGTVAIEDPAIRARCDAKRLPLGEEITVRCTTADVAARTVRFERIA